MELHLALVASPLPAAPGRRSLPRVNFAINSTTAINNIHLSQEKLRSLDSWAEHNLLTFLKPVEKCWQPQDFLPDPSHLSPAELGDAVRELQERAAEIPDEVWVCMVGNMVTEEALPTYQSLMSSVMSGGSGAGSTPWERWIRGWSAEENRHGDLLNKYLYHTGRLDMRQVEKTIQYLIGAGMETKQGSGLKLSPSGGNSSSGAKTPARSKTEPRMASEGKRKTSVAATPLSD